MTRAEVPHNGSSAKFVLGVEYSSVYVQVGGDAMLVIQTEPSEVLGAFLPFAGGSQDAGTGRGDLEGRDRGRFCREGACNRKTLATHHEVER